MYSPLALDSVERKRDREKRERKRDREKDRKRERKRERQREGEKICLTTLVTIMDVCIMLNILRYKLNSKFLVLNP